MEVAQKLLSIVPGFKGFQNNKIRVIGLFSLTLFTSLSIWSNSALAVVDQIQGDCAATIDGQALNCTSNSVELATVTVISIDGLPVASNPSCIAGTTIDVVVELGLEGSGNSDAYDLGVFLALDGLDPAIPASAGGSQLCDIQNLEAFPPPLVQFDAVPDICGDFDAPGGNTVLNFSPQLESISMSCTPGPTGKLVFPFVVTWTNSGNNDVCTGAGDLRAGTRSNCSTEDQFYEIDVNVFGGITVTKQTTPNADPANFAFTTSGGLDAPAFSLADGDSQLLGTIGPLTLATSVFTITESTLPAGWEIAGIECTGADSVNVDLANQRVDVGLSIENPTADCTFNNDKLASLTIVKNTSGGNDVFQFTGSNGIGDFGINTTTLNTGSITFNNLSPATDYSITELLTSSPGWEFVSATCSNFSGNLVPDADAPALTDINLRSGEQVTCTFNNVRQGTINFVKETVGGDGSFDYTTDLPGGNFSLSAIGGSSPPKSLADVSPGSYSVTETVPAGWDLTGLSCNDPDGGTTWNPATGVVTLDVDAGETIDCTYQNTRHGTLIVEKHTVPRGETDSFEFSGDLAGNLTDRQQLTISDDFASALSSAELVPAGWNLTNIECSGATDSTVAIGGTPEFVPGDTSIAVLPAPGETVICVFTNTRQGSITIAKHVTATDPLLSLDFEFASNTLPSPGDSFILSPVDENTDDEITINDLVPGVYDVRELNNINSGWQEINAVCDDGSPLNAIVVSPAEDVTCTFTNAPIGSATIVKNSFGGDGTFDFLWGTVNNPNTPENSPANFSLVTTNAAQSDDFTFELQIDQPYDLTETNLPASVGPYAKNWNLSDIFCVDPTGNTQFNPGQNGSDATLIADSEETVTCTFVNTLDGSLVIRKQTIPDQFDQNFSFTGTEAGLTGSLNDFDTAAAELSSTGQPGIAGTTETVPAGWVLTDISCIGATNSIVSIGGTNGFVPGDTDVSVDLAAGEIVVCTYTNTKDGSLTIVKDAVGGDGAFSFNHNVPAVASPVVIDTSVDNINVLSTSLQPGTYNVSEVTPSGWDLTNIVCSGDTDSSITIGGAGDFDPGDTGITVDMLSGEDITCTFTNTRRASLELVKTVVNNHGGTAVETDWILSADGTTPLSGAGGVAATEVIPGSYVLSETAGPAGYTAGSWSCTAGTLNGSTVEIGPGEVAVCTIVNDDDAASLALVKSVTNNDGGTAVDTDWTLNAAGPTPLSGAGGVPATAVSAGTYTLSESGGPPGYTAGAWSCTGGTLTGSSVELILGESAVCTIVNDDEPAVLELIKTVTNNNGGTAVATDWTLSASGPTPLSGAGGVVATPVSAGLYTLSESGGPDGYNRGAWFCTAGTLNVDQLTIGNGVSATCTINNNDVGPGITLLKAVTNDHGGTLTAADFDLHLTGGAYDGSEIFASGSSPAVDAGITYTMSETPEQGYTETGIVCIDDVLLTGVAHPVTLQPGQAVTCTISNDDDPGVLTLVKSVINDSGGTAQAIDWTLNAAGPTPISGASGSAAVTDVDVAAGVYTLSEFGGPTGYTAGTWSCTAGSLAGDQLTLANGESATCTIVNDDDGATLTLVKSVTNDNGGSALITDWTLSAAGPTPISGASGDAAITAAAVDAGVYTLSEANGPSGYTAGTWSCTAGSLAGDQLTLALTNNATCTIINDDDPATLTLVKTVTNDNGGSAVATDWTLSAQGPTPISGASGDASITAAPVDAGIYTLAEANGPDGYSAGSWSCTAGSLVGNSLTLTIGESSTCSINNDDGAATLTLVKTVTNDNGGTAVITDWTLSAAGPTPISGASGDATVTDAAVDAGVYTLAEANGPDGYTAGSWVCSAGNLAGDQLTLDVGESAICTINNNDEPAALTLVKTVTNDNGGTAIATDWTLSAAGPTPISGASGDVTVTDAAVDAGDYTLAEADGPSGYVPGDWSCTAGTLLGDSLTLTVGESATCTIDNDDVAPGLTLRKVVINDNDGTAINTDWTLRADGPVSISGAHGDTSITGADVPAGVYTLSETDGPARYVASDWVCEGGSLSGDQLTIGSGETAICTITNDDSELLPMIPVPVNNKLSLLLLTLLMFASGLYYRRAVIRRT